MITPADDYPLHQTADPIAFAGTDRNFYDRFFFNGYDKQGTVFFGVALGVYPQLDVMDAAFSVSIEGKQYNLRSSKRMHGQRMDLRVGPITIEILQPLASVRIQIADKDNDVFVDLICNGRHFPIQEPRFTRRIGTRAFMDYTRLSQQVVWQGVIEVKGHRIEVDTANYMGTRDRSWGIRPVGAPDSQPPAGGDFGKQFFWMWTPINFDNAVSFFHTNDDDQGQPWNRRAVIQMLDGKPREFEDINYDIQWRPQSRRAEGMTVVLEDDKGQCTVTLSPGSLEFYMSGLGYFDPVWAHGTDHGELETFFDIYDSEDKPFADRKWMHIQAFSHVELKMDGIVMQGVGAYEQLYVGPHEPTGLGDGMAPPAHEGR